MTDTIIQQLRASPKLELYLEEIQRLLREERIKRNEFYRVITPKDKAEFINGEMVFHSPVRLRHNRVGKLLLKLVDTYVQMQRLGVLTQKVMEIIMLTRRYSMHLHANATFTMKQRQEIRRLHQDEQMSVTA